MFGLTKKEKLETIIKIVGENDLTAYEIGKNTGLSVSGIDKILNGTVKKPQNNSLDKILLFLEKRLLGSDLGKAENILQEPNEEYAINTSPSDKIKKCNEEVNRLTTEIVNLHKILRKNRIPFKNIFEEDI